MGPAHQSGLTLAVALGKLPAHLVPMEAIDQALERTELNLGSDPMLLQMGPARPDMHGTVRIVMELRGETIERCDVQVGYLHRGFEKMCERGSWTQVFPYVDRANHCSPMLNNVGFALACEKLLGVQVPERCQWREAYGYTQAATESLASTS